MTPTNCQAIVNHSIAQGWIKPGPVVQNGPKLHRKEYRRLWMRRKRAQERLGGGCSGQGKASKTPPEPFWALGGVV